jgi:hypothetical protein
MTVLEELPCFHFVVGLGLGRVVMTMTCKTGAVCMYVSEHL